MQTKKRLDFFARRNHYIDHLAPVWNAMPEDRRGTFYVNEQTFMYAKWKTGADPVIVSDLPISDDPVLVCAYGDMNRASRAGRVLINMEHGTGHTFNTPAYPNGRGARDFIDLFLAPNEYTAQKIRDIRMKPVKVIGTPKMDDLLKSAALNPNDGTVCIAFHWGNKKTKPAEAGSALDHYRAVLPILKRQYKLIAHGHPLAEVEHRQLFDDLGIEYVPTFEEVCRRASLYINDLSSTLYEFMALGKPVILLNAPWFRRDVNYGIRFWDYSNIGFNVDDPKEIFSAIDTMLERPYLFRDECAKARRDLYPFLGVAAEIAVNRILHFMEDDHE